MKTDRRSFLKGVLGTSAVMLLPKGGSWAGLETGQKLILPETEIVSVEDLSALDPPFAVTGWNLLADRGVRVEEVNLGVTGKTVDWRLIPNEIWQEAKIRAIFVDDSHSMESVHESLVTAFPVTWRLPLPPHSENEFTAPVIHVVVNHVDTVLTTHDFPTAEISVALYADYQTDRQVRWI
jgi:hypothetical protein